MTNAKQNFHPCLPKLETEKADLGASEYGTFIRGGRDLLRVIADSLDFEAADYSKVNSIPSPWSRSLQFMSAITNKNYPNRNWFIAQYRGFLAAIALSEYSHLYLGATQIDLTHKNEQNKKFSIALRALKPDVQHSILEKEIDIKTQWLKPYLFRLDRAVIGMTNPATLVTPSSHLPISVEKRILWVKNGYFEDPVSQLGSRERYLIAAWLYSLYDDIERNPVNSQLAGQVIAELQLFEADLMQTETTPSEAKPATNGHFGVPFAPAPLHVLTPMILTDTGAGDLSNVEVIASPGLSQSKPIYVIDKQHLPAKMQRQASEILVYGTLSLQAFNLNNHAKDDALFFKPEDFFIDELFYIEGENLLPGTWISKKIDIYESLDLQSNKRKEAKTIFLPLNPILKHYFSSPDLEMMTTLTHIKQGHDQKVRVSLQLPLSGFGDRPITYEVSKEFVIKPENSLRGAIPVLAMWPNVPLNSWKQYYVFADASEHIETAFSIAQPTQDSSSSFRVLGQQNQATNKPSPNAPKALVGRQPRYQYWECQSHPNILEAVDRDGRKLGLIPLEIPEVRQGGVLDWTVGVDFGTSFTNLSVRKGNGDPQWLNLKTHLLSITATPPVPRDLAYRELFIPETFVKGEENFPMATMITTMGWTEPGGAVIPEPIKEARIYTPRLDKFEFNVDHIKSNIKWDKIQYQSPFISHLQRYVAAQAALEGITTVNWAVSYPSTFSPHELEMYLGTWDRTIRQLGALTHQTHTRNVDLQQTESIAFAQFYKTICAGVEDNLLNTICVDIGGGTSDIAVFRDNKIAYQTSVSYAGRDIFHRMLKLNAKSIGDIFGLSDQVSKDLQKKLSGNNFNSALDNYLRGNSREILETGYVINANKPKNKEFRTLLAFAFGGLYHYLGLVQRHMIQDGVTNVASVFMGGNGSRLLDWLTPTGTYTANSEINKLLRGIMERSSGLKPNPNLNSILCSKNPKEEVCTGLVVPDPMALEHTEQFEPFLGEACEINGVIFEGDSLLRLPDEWKTINSFTIKGTKELENYIQNFNQVIVRERIGGVQVLPNFGRQGDFEMTDESRNSISNIIKGDYQEKLKKSNKKEDFELESTFLLQLRAFVDILANRWAQSNGGN